MAGFLRKKSSSNAKSQQQQTQPTSSAPARQVEPAQAPPQSLPPLYARFATSSKNVASAGSASTTPKVVSGPMALGSNIRRDGTGIARMASHSRNDVNELQNPPPPPPPVPRPRAAEPPKPAARESWYTPAPNPDPPATPRSQAHSHSHSHHHHHHHHHSSTKHGSRRSPEPVIRHSPTRATPHHEHARHEKPLPKPVPTPSIHMHVPTSRQARVNSVALRKETAPLAPMTSPATLQDPPHIPESVGSHPQKPAYHPPTLLNSSNNDLPLTSIREGILRNAIASDGDTGAVSPQHNEMNSRLPDEPPQAPPMSKRTSTMIPSPILTSQVRSPLLPNAVQKVSSPKAPVAIVPNSPSLPLSHRMSMQAELVHSPAPVQEYNNSLVTSQSPSKPPGSSDYPLPPERPTTPPMAIGKFKSVFRSDRKATQPPPLSSFVAKEDHRLSSTDRVPEPLPRATITVSPTKTPSPPISQDHAHQGMIGMVHQDTQRISPIQRHVHQPQYQDRSPSQTQTVSPPLSPNSDKQQFHMPGKPLIFTAMHVVDQEEPRQSVVANFTMNGSPKMTPTVASMAYPSPPMEFSPSPLNRTRPLPSQNLAGSFLTRDLPSPPKYPYVTATPPPTPPKQPLGASPRVPNAQLMKSPGPLPTNLPVVQTALDKPLEASPSSRSGSPLNNSPSLHHIRKLSKSTISVRSQVTSQLSISSSPTSLSSSAQQVNGLQQPSSRGTPAVSSRLLPPADPNGSDEGLLLDADPFARLEGVKMLKPSSNEPGSRAHHRRTPSKPDSDSSGHGREKRAKTSSSKPPSPEPVSRGNSQDEERPDSIAAPATPETPQNYLDARSRRRGAGLEKAPPPQMADIPLAKDRPSNPFPLELLIAEPDLLSGLLTYLSFAQWSALTCLSKQIRGLLLESAALREVILERYLSSSVGYERWTYEGSDPLPLSIKDLNDYMRGISIPTHEYARIAGLYIHSRSNRGIPGYEAIQEQVRSLSACTRAYTRVVLRLRTQAEAEHKLQLSRQPRAPPPAIYNHTGFGSPARSMVSVSSRAPSPSSMSHSHASLAHGSSAHGHPTTSGSSTFRSPLYRMRRAPLLRVFVPSPDEWLPDAGIVDCENELKRAGAMDLMRLGDVVWDVAVGDEGNVGRLVWDGSYLLDLDYTYSTTGDLPKYIHSLAFPPSYFHRVIRTGTSSSNPIAHIDIRPWGEEIAANLQLLQDRVRTETPQGNYHNVVRWVHRSTFTIRPAGRAPSRPSSRAGSRSHSNHGHTLQNARIPIPDAEGLFVDSGWYGTVVVETEGTNEALADLQDRCGPGAFPPRVKSPHERFTPAKDKDSKKVFRVLRERSRPGEIWIRAVSNKERLL